MSTLTIFGSVLIDFIKRRGFSDVLTSIFTDATSHY